jgi:hypothetical protein
VSHTKLLLQLKGQRSFSGQVWLMASPPSTAPGPESSHTPAQQISDVDLPACTSAFDALWFCFSPINQVRQHHFTGATRAHAFRGPCAAQFKKYYRDGNYDDCNARQVMPGFDLDAFYLPLGMTDSGLARTERRGSYMQRMFELCMKLRWKSVNGKETAPEARKYREEMLALSSKSTRDHVWIMKNDPRGPPHAPAEVAEDNSRGGWFNWRAKGADKST